LDSLGLTISTVTPPDGLSHTTRKQEILDLPNYLRVNANSDGDDLMVLVVSSSVPAVGDHDKIWVKTDAIDVVEGTTHYTQRGCYKFDSATGIWDLMAGIGIYVGDTAPTDTEVLWLNTTESVSYAKGLYYYTGGAWTLMDDMSIHVGAAAPTNTTRPWLKTDSVTTVQGLYVYEGAVWVLKSSPIVIQDTAPASGAIGMLWLKSTDEGGLWRWNGSAWVNATMPIMASGDPSQIVVPSTTPPNATERVGSLWAKIGSPPNGLFWADTVNGYWESIHPIMISYRYPAVGTAGITPTSSVAYTGLPYSIICPTLGTAYFVGGLELPMMTVMIEYDDKFAITGSYLNIGVSPSSATFDIAAYNPDAGPSNRELVFRVSANGRMRIPF